MKKIFLSILLTFNSSPLRAMKIEDLLFHAAINDSFELAKHLIASEVSVNARTLNGQTPLMFAVVNGRQRMCEFLLDNGADPNARDNNDLHPLFYAVANPEISLLLIQRGAQINAGNTQWEYRPLLYAATIDPHLCSLFIEHGADPRLLEKLHWRTPLIHAVAHDENDHSDKCIQILKTQYRINKAIETTLLCLNRIRKDNGNAKIKMCMGELYRQFKTFLLPHMGNYVPLKELLNMRDIKHARAFDYKPHIDWLNPDRIYELLEPKADKSWNCSIQ